MTKCLKPDLYYTGNNWKNEQSIKKHLFADTEKRAYHDSHTGERRNRGNER